MHLPDFAGQHFAGHACGFELGFMEACLGNAKLCVNAKPRRGETKAVPSAFCNGKMINTICEYVSSHKQWLTQLAKLSRFGMCWTLCNRSDAWKPVWQLI